MTGLDRRRMLVLAGAGLATLAGCSESADDDTGNGDGESIDGGDLPSYASVLPETDRSPYFYGAIDVETMTALVDDDGADAGEEPTDPLVGNPIVLALVGTFGLNLLATSPAVDPYTAHDETPDGEASFVYVDGVYAFVGEYDRDGLTAALENAGYESETADGSYDVVTDPETGEVVGVTDDLYAFTYPNQEDPEYDPLAAVERTVETAVGQREPKHATADGFDSLLRAGEPSGITLGLYTDAETFGADALAGDPEDESDDLEFAFDAFDGAFGVHQHLSLEGDDARASAVVSYADEDRVDIDRLESMLGTDADSFDVTRDGTFVWLEAEYLGDVS